MDRYLQAAGPALRAPSPWPAAVRRHRQDHVRVGRVRSSSSPAVNALHSVLSAASPGVSVMHSAGSLPRDLPPTPTRSLSASHPVTAPVR